MKLRFHSVLPLAALAALSLTTAGCGKEVVRGSNDPSIDAPPADSSLGLQTCR